MLRESRILVYKVDVIGINCGRVYKSRQNRRKCVFDKNEAILDLEHLLGLALSTI